MDLNIDILPRIYPFTRYYCNVMKDFSTLFVSIDHRACEYKAAKDLFISRALIQGLGLEFLSNYYILCIVYKHALYCIYGTLVFATTPTHAMVAGLAI